MFGWRGVVVFWGVLALACLGGSVHAESRADAAGPMLLADDLAEPHVRLRWMQGDGTEVVYDLDLPWTSTDDRTVIGRNLEVFAALGGSRLEHGAGHPDGAIVRVGFYKTDRDLLFFEDIANGSSVEIELRNVRFNQDVTPDPATLLQRLRYRVDDVQACGLTIDKTEMFNVASADDDMGGTILPGQTRFGSIAEGEESPAPGSAHADLWVEDDGSVSMDVVLPYGMLRHKGDPWGLEVPGTFFEPFHFDLEFQVLPREVAEVEGVELPPRPHRRGGPAGVSDSAGG